MVSTACSHEVMLEIVIDKLWNTVSRQKREIEDLTQTLWTQKQLTKTESEKKAEWRDHYYKLESQYKEAQAMLSNNVAVPAPPEKTTEIAKWKAKYSIEE